MRPIFQELCLPQLGLRRWRWGVGVLVGAAIASSSTSAYPTPVLVRRDSAWWIDEAYAHKLRKLGIPPTDLLGDTDALLRTYVKTHHDTDLDFDPARRSITAVLEDVSVRAERVDASLRQRPLATGAYVDKRRCATWRRVW